MSTHILYCYPLAFKENKQKKPTIYDWRLHTIHFFQAGRCEWCVEGVIAWNIKTGWRTLGVHCLPAQSSVSDPSTVAVCFFSAFTDNLVENLERFSKVDLLWKIVSLVLSPNSFIWMEKAPEPIWINRCVVRKAYFLMPGLKVCSVSTLSSGRFLKLCLQCRERSQHRWLGTKGSRLFLMPLNGSTLFLS